MIGSYSLPDATFNGHCLMNSNNSVFKKLINPYTSYTCSRDLNTYFTWGNCLFGVAKFTKNSDPDKHGYSAYVYGFDVRSQFSLLDGSWNKNVIIFGVQNIYLVHILVLVESSTQRLHDTTTTAEVKCLINFTQTRKNCVMSALW